MNPKRKLFLIKNRNLITWQELSEIDIQLEVDKARKCPTHNEILKWDGGIMMSNPSQIDFICPFCQYSERTSLPEGT